MHLAGPELPQRAGPYRLLDRIGEGGMGVVHLAATPDGRLVAVKLLRAHVVAGAQGRARLAREVDSLRRVRGPRVAEVIDADIDAEPPYVVTRYVPGLAVDAVVRSHGALRLEAVVDLAAGLVEALAVVHAAHVVHRDVKPGNVMITTGQVVLIDFGLARTADDLPLTVAGYVMGTPAYMAPESVLGLPSTPATDVHGWAATLVYAATGHAPYGGGNDWAVLDRIRRGDADLSGLPPELMPLVVACLCAEPAARPGLADLRDGLRRLGAVAGTGGPQAAHLQQSAVPAGSGWPGHPPPRHSPAAEQPAAGTHDAATASHNAVRTPATPPAGDLAATYVHPVDQRWPGPPVPAPPGNYSTVVSRSESGDFRQADATTQHSTYRERTRVEPVARPPVDPWRAPPALATEQGAGPGRDPIAGDAWLRAGNTQRVGYSAVLLGVAGFALAATATAAAPWIAGLAGLGLLTLSRAVWRIHADRARRRLLFGQRRGDWFASLARSPWYLVASALRSLAQASLVLSVAVLVAFVAVAQGGFSDRNALLAAGGAASVAAWRGPGSANVRRGAWLVLSRSRAAMTVLAVVVFIAAWLLGMWVDAYGTAWWPFSPPR